MNFLKKKTKSNAFLLSKLLCQPNYIYQTKMFWKWMSSWATRKLCRSWWSKFADFHCKHRNKTNNKFKILSLNKWANHVRSAGSYKIMHILCKTKPQSKYQQNSKWCSKDTSFCKEFHNLLDQNLKEGTPS